MNWFWFALSVVAVPCIVAAATLIPDQRDRKRRQEWDAWAKREREKHNASQEAKAGTDWTYGKKGRRL
jgi:hypothetical protein